VSGVELLRDVYVWLPLLFALDLALFQLAADDPLALRWWWRRPRQVERSLELA
jgi:hypothetical protein